MTIVLYPSLKKLHNWLFSPIGVQQSFALRGNLSAVCRVCRCMQKASGELSKADFHSDLSNHPGMPSKKKRFACPWCEQRFLPLGMRRHWKLCAHKPAAIDITRYPVRDWQFGYFKTVEDAGLFMLRLAHRDSCAVTMIQPKRGSSGLVKVRWYQRPAGRDDWQYRSFENEAVMRKFISDNYKELGGLRETVDVIGFTLRWYWRKRRRLN